MDGIYMALSGVLYKGRIKDKQRKKGKFGVNESGPARCRVEVGLQLIFK